MNKLFKKVFFPDKVKVFLMLSTIIIAYLVISLDDDAEIVEDYLRTNTELREKIGEIKKIDVRKVIYGRSYKYGLSDKEYRLLVIGEKRKADVVVYMKFSDSTGKENRVEYIEIKNVSLRN